MKEVQPIRNIEKIEEMKTELAKTGMRNTLLFVMGINTGLRISDLLLLKVKDVKGKSEYILTEKKTKKKKRIMLHAVMQDISRFTDKMNDDEYLFQSRKGDNVPLTRVQAYRILNNAAKKCNLENIGTHTLRKCFGYHFYQRTKDVALLQEIFNHSSPSITLRYIGITQDEISNAWKDFFL